MTTKEDGQEKIVHLSDLIEGIQVAMMTTVEASGQLRTRPMWTQDHEFVGQLWFFTREHSPKVDEVQQEQNVNLAYSDPSKDSYVSVTGKCQLVRDAAKVKELWKPTLKAWFPKGVEDPEIALLRVDVEKAEYWDTPSSKMVQLVGMVKATLTGTSPSVGDHARVDVKAVTP